MASENASTVNETLTAYAVGFMATRESSLLDKVAPLVATGVSKGDYKYFDEDAPFEVHNTNVAKGGEAPAINWDATIKTFRCEAHGLKVANYDEEENEAPPAAREMLRNNKLISLLSTQLVNREVRGFSKIFAAISPVVNRGKYLGPAGAATNIWDEFDEEIERINNATGRMPEHIAFGLSMWRAIKNHPSVVGRFSGIKSAVTPEEFAGLLINPNIKIHIGSMPYKSTPRGKKGGNKGIVGGEALIYHSSQTPTTDDMSAIKTFSVDGNLITAVHTIDDRIHHTTWDEVRWSEDIRITAPIAISRISLS